MCPAREVPPHTSSSAHFPDRQLSRLRANSKHKRRQVSRKRATNLWILCVLHTTSTLYLINNPIKPGFALLTTYRAGHRGCWPGCPGARTWACRTGGHQSAKSAAACGSRPRRTGSGAPGSRRRSWCCHCARQWRIRTTTWWLHWFPDLNFFFLRCHLFVSSLAQAFDT